MKIQLFLSYSILAITYMTQTSLIAMEPEEHGQQPVIIAAIDANENNTVEKLLLKVSDINGDYKDFIDSWTLLTRAATGGNTAIAKRLLARKADPNKTDKDGRLPLTQAAINGHLEIVSALLQHGADPNKTDRKGQTALVASVGAENQIAIQTALLGNGARLDARDSKGMTALDKARESDEPVARLLAHRNGCFVNQWKRTAQQKPTTYLGTLPRELLQELAQYDEYNHRYKNLTFLFIEAIIQKNRRQAQGILDQCCCPEQLSHLINTPYRHSEYSAFIAELSMLHPSLAQTIDPFFSNIPASASESLHHVTPLGLAVFGNDAEMVRLLLEHNASVNQKFGLGLDALCPLHMAARSSPGLIPLLLQNGADKEAKTAHGMTPLMAACNERAPLESFQQLVEAGANIHATVCMPNLLEGNKKYFITPFSIACNFKQYKKVEILLEKGIDPNEEYPDGRTPFTIALDTKDERMVQLLLDYGADVMQALPSGKSILDEVIDKYPSYFSSYIIPVMLNHGAPISAHSQAGVLGGLDLFTPSRPFFKNCLIALLQNNQPLLQKMVEHADGNSLNTRDLISGKNLLMWATCRGNQEAVNLLLNAYKNPSTLQTMRNFFITSNMPKQVDINAQDDEGRTALMWAARLGRREIYHALLRHGASADFKDRNGKTALDHARLCKKML